MRFSPLVDRIAGRGAGAWSIHMEAARVCDQGQDVIFLTVGDFRPCRANSRSSMRSRADHRAVNPALSVEPNRNPRCSPTFAGLIAANHGRALGGAFGAPDGLAGVENRSDDECRC